MGRKRSTVQGYESIVRVHLTPHFGDRPIGGIGRPDVEGLMAASRAAGRTVKTTPRPPRRPALDLRVRAAGGVGVLFSDFDATFESLAVRMHERAHGSCGAA